MKFKALWVTAVVAGAACGVVFAQDPFEEWRTVEFGEKLAPNPAGAPDAVVPFEKLPAAIRRSVCARAGLVLKADHHDRLRRAQAEIWLSGEDVPDTVRIELPQDEGPGDGLSLQCVTTTNGFRVILPLPKEQPDPRAYFERRCEQLFNLNDGPDDHRLTVPWPAKLEPGVRFSTSPKTLILGVSEWDERVDFVVDEKKSLHVLTYNPIPQQARLKDGAKWFPVEFRETIEKRASASPDDKFK